jgi:tRNA dimethylallyltransferase
MRPMPAPIVLVVGPTASGKTALGIALAKALGGDVVNVDSVQLYRRLDIGSAKPSAEERAAVRHHLLDVVEPDGRYDAATYARAADEVVSSLRAAGRPAIFVGGTGLYTRALVRGLAEGIASDPATRRALDARARAGEQELARMHAELASVDPDYAARIARTDPIRIVRGLEVFSLTGIPLSVHHARHAAAPPRYRALWLGLDVPREALRARIEERTRSMLARGWIEEVRGLVRDHGPALRSLGSVGYAEVTRFVVEGRTDTVALSDEVVRATAAFAKRQRTWFRGEPEVRWGGLEEFASPTWVQRIRGFLLDGTSVDAHPPASRL